MGVFVIGGLTAPTVVNEIGGGRNTGHERLRLLYGTALLNLYSESWSLVYHFLLDFLPTLADG